MNVVQSFLRTSHESIVSSFKSRTRDYRHSSLTSRRDERKRREPVASSISYTIVAALRRSSTLSSSTSSRIRRYPVVKQSSVRQCTCFTLHCISQRKLDLSHTDLVRRVRFSQFPDSSELCRGLSRYCRHRGAQYYLIHYFRLPSTLSLQLDTINSESKAT